MLFTDSSRCYDVEWSGTPPQARDCLDERACTRTAWRERARLPQSRAEADLTTPGDPAGSKNMAGMRGSRRTPSEGDPTLTTTRAGLKRKQRESADHDGPADPGVPAPCVGSPAGGSGDEVLKKQRTSSAATGAGARTLAGPTAARDRRVLFPALSSLISHRTHAAPPGRYSPRRARIWHAHAHSCVMRGAEPSPSRTHPCKSAPSHV